MELSSLDVWSEFEDLSLLPFSSQLVSGFDETLFDDIFNNSLLGKCLSADNNDTSYDLDQALEELGCSQLAKDEVIIKDNEGNLLPNSLESNLILENVLDDSFVCDPVDTALLDHSYSQRQLCIADNREANKVDQDDELKKPNEILFKANIKKQHTAVRKPFISSLFFKGKSMYTAEFSTTYKFSTQVNLSKTKLHFNRLFRIEQFKIVMKGSEGKI